MLRFCGFARVLRSWRMGRSRAGDWSLGLALALALGTPACTKDIEPPPVDAAIATDTGASADVSSDGPGCPADNGPVDPTLLIDDFEDGSFVAPPIAGRMGGWYTSGDATPSASMRPLGNAPPDPIPGGRCGSRRALHVSGAGFNDWGSQVNLAMHFGANAAGVSEELPYDAAARGYQGVTFFARVGDTSVNTVRFAVADQYARPEAGLCVPSSGPATECYDTFGVLLSQTLSTEWKQFRIPWTGLAQRGFGLPGGIAPDASKLYDISFTFPDHAVFDLWVDDISFY